MIEPWLRDRVQLSVTSRYALALVILVVAFLLRLAILPAQSVFPFVTFYPAMAVTFYFCGIRPGALVAILSAVVADYFFIPPYSSFSFTPEGGFALFAFLISGFLTGWIVNRLNETISALERSEHRYHAELEDQTELICRYSADTTLLYVNNAFCKTFGKTSESLIGSKWQPIAYADDIQLISEKLSQLSPANPVVTIENRIITDKDDIRWEQFVNHAFFDRDGQLIEIQSVGRDITERKQMESALRENQELLQSFIKNAPVELAMFDLEMRYLAVSNRWMTDQSLGDQNIIGRSHYDVFPDIPERWKLLHRRCLNGERLRADEDCFERADGSKTWLQWEIWPWHKADGSIGGIVFAGEDITARKLTTNALREAEERFRFILENSPIAIRILNIRTSQIVFANRQYRELINATDGEVIGISPKHYYATPQDYDDTFEQVIKDEPVTDRLVELLVPGKQAITKWVLASYLKLNFQNEPAILGWLYDISDRKAMEDQALHLAHFDPLTELPNRTLFYDRFQQALTVARRDKVQLALMFIDLDKFKPINDVLGHDVGDLMLSEVARRIQNCLRESDTVARIGGDEFVVLLPKIETEQNSLEVAEKIRYSLNRPFELAGRNLHISSSTGIAIYPEHGNDVKSLMKNADFAMYFAKKSGRDNVKIYHCQNANS